MGPGPGKLWGLPYGPGARRSADGISGESGRSFQGGLKDGGLR